jgi:RNA polymerase sigma factor (sigma-70 family)
MPADKTDQWFKEATNRWPAVKWPKAAYDAHLAGESPPYPIDLFLAGAAGYRIDAAWEAIESDFAPKAKNILQRQPTADMGAEELWAETILRVIAEDPQRDPLPDQRRPAFIIRYRGLVQLINYLILIAKRIGIQRKRRMRGTLSLSADDAGHPHDFPQDSPSPPEQLESSEDAAALRSAIAAAYEKLSSEQRFLIAMVYRSGMKQKDAGKMLGWSEFKTCRQLASAMETLRRSIAQWAGADWAGDLSAAWEQSVQKCWNQLQLPPKKASENRRT